MGSSNRMVREAKYEERDTDGDCKRTLKARRCTIVVFY